MLQFQDGQNFSRPQNAFLLMVILFCSLSELPEVHMAIASRPDVLHQLICISLSPSVRTMSSILVATLYLCLAATQNAHSLIAGVGIIGLLEVCNRADTPETDKDKSRDILLLK